MENKTSKTHENGNNPNRLLVVGDRVKHELFGTGEVFEISHNLGFADVNLDEEYIDNSGIKRNSVIVSISDLVTY